MTMTKLMIAASGAALLLMAPAAFAQSGANTQPDASATTSGGSGTDMTTGSGSQRAARDVTCREITALDTETVRGILYFIRGYSEGERSAGQGMQVGAAGGSGSSTSTDMGASTDTAAAGASGSSTTTTGAGASTDTAAAGGSGSSTSTDMGTSTDTAAAGGSGSSTSTDMGTSTDTAAAAGTDSDMATTGSSTTAGSGATPQLVAIQGYFDIPVEQTLVACQASPDRTASEVIDEQSKGAGSTSAQ